MGAWTLITLMAIPSAGAVFAVNLSCSTLDSAIAPATFAVTCNATGIARITFRWTAIDWTTLVNVAKPVAVRVNTDAFSRVTCTTTDGIAIRINRAAISADPWAIHSAHTDTIGTTLFRVHAAVTVTWRWIITTRCPVFNTGACTLEEAYGALNHITAAVIWIWFTAQKITRLVVTRMRVLSRTLAAL
jgi:hypothetical protein